MAASSDTNFAPTRRMDAFFKGIELRSRYEYIGADLPQRAKLDKMYDWENNDLPAIGDIVQWVLLLDFVYLSSRGNKRFQECWLKTPAGIKKILLSFMLKKLYPHVAWNANLPTDDPDLYLPYRGEVVEFCGYIFLKKDVPFIFDSAVVWPFSDKPEAAKIDLVKSLGRNKYLPQELPNYLDTGKIPYAGAPIDWVQPTRPSSTTDVRQPPVPVMETPPLEKVSLRPPAGNRSKFVVDESYAEPEAELERRSPSSANDIFIDSPPAQSNPVLPEINRIAFPRNGSFPLQEEVLDPTYVESSAHESHKIPIRRPPADTVRQSSGAIPTVSLPQDGERVFMGSGVTQSVLGRGGMGIVYLIFVKQLEVLRAVKLLNPMQFVENAQEFEKFKERFTREAKILSNLHHTHIAQIHQFGDWQGYPYIEMEYVEGSSINNIISSSGRISAAACTAIGIQIARALRHAHNKAYLIDGRQHTGLVHRDLKPSNVIVSQDGESKLLDFGIAIPAGMVTHTMKSNFVGTLQYAAPEQIKGEALDQRTDIFSFGCIIHEMLTGAPAFRQTTVAEILQARMSNKYASVDEYRIKIPRSLRYILRTCMNIDAEERFVSSDDLLEVLEQAHRDLTAEMPDAVVKEWVHGRQYNTSRIQIDDRMKKNGFWKKIIKPFSNR
jgi:predicted Ser/Thr protein kinase